MSMHFWNRFLPISIHYILFFLKNNQCTLIRTNCWLLLLCYVLFFVFFPAKLQISQPVAAVQTHQRGIDLKPAERRPGWQSRTPSVFPLQTSTLGEPLPCCFHQTASSPCVPLPAGKPFTHEFLLNGHFCQWNQFDCCKILSTLWFE